MGWGVGGRDRRVGRDRWSSTRPSVYTTCCGLSVSSLLGVVLWATCALGHVHCVHTCPGAHLCHSSCACSTMAALSCRLDDDGAETTISHLSFAFYPTLHLNGAYPQFDEAEYERYKRHCNRANRAPITREEAAAAAKKVQQAIK